ncbi:MAG: L-threonylcarbamoyladenylate synthase [Muribaculum sp.]|nr:L-threonylcarbamoyladenylate synthase [Muribaculaceae bacterium]MCM1080294.1 L-threonylcarbamoyladenylate synthase [Muribaculum sp.]
MNRTRLSMFHSSINQRYIDLAVEALRRGEIIIYPTDSLYALACDALNQRAVEKICQYKGINPRKTNLSVVCCDISQASEYARIDNRVYDILRRNTPGAFTFLLPAASTLPRVFKDRRIVGLRIPDNAIARNLAKSLGNPLLSTSLPANPVTGEHIVTADEAELLNAPLASLIIDGGDCRAVPSTIVDLTDSSAPEIMRQGTATLL